MIVAYGKQNIELIKVDLTLGVCEHGVNKDIVIIITYRFFFYPHIVQDVVLVQLIQQFPLDKTKKNKFMLLRCL